MHSGINKMKPTFLLILIIALGLTACAQSENAKLEQSRQFEKKALELRLKKDFRGALREQLKAVELNPKNAKPLTILAGIYEEIGETENAPENLQKSKEVLEKAIKLNSNDAIARDMYSAVLDQTGDKQGALRERLEAAKLDPTNLTYLTNVGVQQNALNDNASARETYQKVLKKNPDFIYALYHFGVLEREEGNYEKSVDLLTRAIDAKATESDDEQFQETARERLEQVRQQLKDKPETGSNNHNP